jgi:hypothetical protein
MTLSEQKSESSDILEHWMSATEFNFVVNCAIADYLVLVQPKSYINAVPFMRYRVFGHSQELPVAYCCCAACILVAN